jgi:hypothetical protein
MMPIADAARAARHETAILTSGELASLVAPMRVLSAGPPREITIGETVARTGSHPAQPGPGAVELFAGVRVDLSFDPELMVCERLDFVGPLVAAGLGIPWAAHTISGALSEPLWNALQARLARQYESRSLAVKPKIALIDPYPDALRSPTEQPAEDRITIQPWVNEHSSARTAEPISDDEHPAHSSRWEPQWMTAQRCPRSPPRSRRPASPRS